MSNYKSNLTIAIDGHSSTGKSSFAKAIAAKLGYLYVDSGAMYRAVTLHCMEQGLFEGGQEPPMEDVVKQLAGIDVRFRRDPDGQNQTYLGHRLIEKEIRSMEVSGHVSYISTIPAVRTAMVEQQRKMGKAGGVVMDGRDIGTVVFPKAEIKIFMTALPEIRAERRYKELQEKGVDETLEDVTHNINKRDRIDSGRETSPLIRADDAIHLDNSYITIEEQMKWFFETFGQILEHGKKS